MAWKKENGEYVWYPDEGILSPYEQAAQTGGQAAGDNLLAASNEYYGNATPAAQQEHAGTNWTDPSSYSWLTNTPSQPGPKTTEDPPTPPPTSGGGTSGGTSVPQFTAPALPTIAPFASKLNPYEFTPYEPFKAPTLEDAKNEPGYEFARTEGIRALMNANLPMLRSGGTLKNLIGWGDRFAEQNYGNVYNRAANTYGINRETHGANEAGKLGQFTTNFGVEKDIWDRNAGLSLDLYDRDLRGKLAEFDPRFDGYLAMLESLTRLGTAGAGL